MRIAADTLAPQAIAGASRRRVTSGTAFVDGTTFAAWPAAGLYGFAGTKPCPPMMSTPVNPSHVGHITARRPSEASP